MLFIRNDWAEAHHDIEIVDDDGKLQFRDDVYGRDARMIEIMKGSERRVADIPVERPPNTSAKPVKMPAGMYAGGDRGYGGGGEGFVLEEGGEKGHIYRYIPIYMCVDVDMGMGVK